MRSLIIPLTILGLPLAEIAGFVVVGRAVGVAATLLLVLLSAVAGVALLRIQGFGVLRRVQESARKGIDPGLDVVGGALVFIAAILLIIPGFISDAVGIFLFLPPIRRALARFLQSRMTILTTGTGFYNARGARSERSQGQVIDLDADEFSRDDDDDNGSAPPSNRLSR
ncbi:FxsA protein [Sinorhizobium sojae CCBAU 05684]|uniref:FxsA protein n=1 Tax=Sinorhizobium sojae CCBAU 05684 TaxID=716928 RepID=A0A249PGF9_9HYPH|nr:FxsA family protein [Sinorhizobium sojae]ASY64797.1 FxsA protein [Sinorhizobium sojae CCBAU 05684]